VKNQEVFQMNNIKAMSFGLALLLGTAGLAFAPASASPPGANLANQIEITPKVELVSESSWWWKHGRRDRDRHHRHFHDGLWFAVPFWLGAAATAPLYADSYYDDEDYGNEHIEYCFSRYRSYDPDSNTFMSYSGVRKPCISPFM
jgi:hypothetical protein